jgi:hypothetical protein
MRAWSRSPSPQHRRFLQNLWEIEDGKRVNPTGTEVFVTKSGSMTKDRFPAFCSHFVKNLPEGQGKGGLPVILIFDGHASRWNFTGLKLLLENNVYCLCLPGHTSIWSQPNDGGANASWKSTIGDAISAWRRKHRPLPGSESILKMTRADWNLIYSTAWIKWKRQQTQLLRDVGSNSITTGWAGTGLAPYTRDAPYWDAALSKWGRRDELSKSAPVGGMGGGAVVGQVRGTCLKRVFEEHAAALAAAPAASTTPAAALAASPTRSGCAPTLALATPAACAQLITPEVARTQAVLESAVKSTHEAVRMRSFATRLKAMSPGNCVQLQPLLDAEGGGDLHAQGATLIAQATGYLLIPTDQALPQEAIALEEADARLASRFVMPAATRAELSSEDASALRAREARHAALAREEAMRAAVDAGMLAWYKEQATLAAELGIDYKDWERITRLMMQPPPQHVGRYKVLNSVAIGRGIAIDAAVEQAVREPLQQAMEAAAERAAAASAGGSKRVVGLTQTTFGRCVTELSEELEVAEDAKARDEEAKRQKQKESEGDKAKKLREKVCEASHSLVAKGDAAKLSISHLVTLIKWAGGEVMAIPHPITLRPKPPPNTCLPSRTPGSTPPHIQPKSQPLPDHTHACTTLRSGT